MEVKQEEIYIAFLPLWDSVRQNNSLKAILFLFQFLIFDVGRFRKTTNKKRYFGLGIVPL